MMIKFEDIKRFCTYCGKEMLKEEIIDPNYSEYARITSQYNDRTGERQYLIKFTCPNYKKSFFKKHDKYYKEFVPQ